MYPPPATKIKHFGSLRTAAIWAGILGVVRQQLAVTVTVTTNRPRPHSVPIDKRYGEILKLTLQALTKIGYPLFIGKSTFPPGRQLIVT